MTMKSKSCEIDPIPTHIFNQLLPSVLHTVTKIVHLSLSEGEFCNKWKVGIVWPLLKKVGLELIKSNYRPASNLTFMSKIIEKCMLHQLNIQIYQIFIAKTYFQITSWHIVRIIPVKTASYDLSMISFGHVNVNQLCLSQCWIYLPHLTLLTTLS